MSLKLVPDNKATMGENLFLTDITKRYIQKENKETKKFEKTDDFVHVYSVVCLDRKFDKIEVKIDEKKHFFHSMKMEKLSDCPNNALLILKTL